MVSPLLTILPPVSVVPFVAAPVTTQRLPALIVTAPIVLADVGQAVPPETS